MVRRIEGIEGIKELYYRSGRRIIRRPECSPDRGPAANIITSKFCKVFGLEADEDGTIFPDYYTGLLYTFPEQNGGDSEAYLFLSSHDSDEKPSTEEMLENVYEHTGRLVFHKAKVVSVKVNSDSTFSIINKNELEGYELFAIDAMFEKHGLERVN